MIFKKKRDFYRGTAFAVSAVMVMTFVSCGKEQGNREEGSENSSAGTVSAAASGTEMGGSTAAGEKLYYNTTGYPICDEPVTLSMMCLAAGNMDVQNRIMVSEIEKRFGIKLDITSFSTSEEFATQLNLSMTTDDLPDLIAPGGAITVNQLREYAEDDYALALNEYAELMPNLQTVMEDYPAYRKYLTSEDGNIYGLSGIEVNEFGRVDRVFINKEWLKNVNMQAPESVDDLYEVLCAFRDQDANGNGDPEDEIPFDYVASNYYDDHMLLAAFGLITDDANYILADDGAGRVLFENTSENYKAYLKYLKKLYNENLINPECYVGTEVERKEKIAKDKTGFFGAPAPFAWGGFDISYDAGFEWVGGLTSEYSSEKLIPLGNTLGSSVVMFVNAETKYPEAAARFLDYWYSEEGEVAAQRGWEGVTMDYVRNDILNGDVATLYCPEGFTSTEDYKINKALIVGPFSYCSRTFGTHYRLLSIADDDVLNSDEAVQAYGWAVLVGRGLRRGGIEEKEVFPNLVYTEEEGNTRTSLYNDLTTYITAQRAEFITKPNIDIDAGWDQYVAQLEVIGLSKILEIEQVAYDRYNR